MSTKNPLTQAGIEPATFRFVAQRLNHCATAVPKVVYLVGFNVRILYIITLQDYIFQIQLDMLYCTWSDIPVAVFVKSV